MNTDQPVLITLFGATGDLAKRKLYGAMFRLYKKGILNNRFAVIGTARREWSDNYFRTIVIESVKDLCEDLDEATEFSSHFYYMSHNVTDTEHYVRLLDKIQDLDKKYDTEGNHVYYLSMAPQFFGTIAHHLKEENFIDSTDGYSRLIIEKPFGTDYPSAVELNNDLAQAFEENQIFRIDHYLGKAFVKNILQVRQANPIIEAAWNREFIQEIQISLLEDMGVGERGDYYDKSGASRDMMQNHLLQIVSLALMELPKGNGSEDVRQSKVKALKDIRLFDPELTTTNIVRGQYGADAQDKVAYRNELNVAEDSTTETYIAGQLVVDNDRWKDVPVYFRTGKNLSDKKSMVHVIFKNSDRPEFENTKQNVLSFYITPEDGIQLSLNAISANANNGIELVELSQNYTKEELTIFPDAYEALIHDCIIGKAENFAHWDEVGQSWKIVDSIRASWKEMPEPHFPNYEIGSMGPYSATELLARNGSSWLD